jgi:hypothetical protein
MRSISKQSWSRSCSVISSVITPGRATTSHRRCGRGLRGIDFPFVTGMDAAGVVERTGKLHIAQQALASLLTLVLLFAAWPQSLVAQAPPGPLQVPPAPPYMQLTPEELQQLVAPIALYPDSLMAQILAASTFPDQVVDADRWVQSHPDLKGEDLAQAVDQLPWDPSVKALAAFPSVLGNMDKNLSWTSSLGDAYYNQEQGVMDAIQVMRRRAQKAGHLNSTPQQTVTTEGAAQLGKAVWGVLDPSWTLKENGSGVEPPKPLYLN